MPVPGNQPCCLGTRGMEPHLSVCPHWEVADPPPRFLLAVPGEVQNYEKARSHSQGDKHNPSTVYHGITKIKSCRVNPGLRPSPTRSTGECGGTSWTSQLQHHDPAGIIHGELVSSLLNMWSRCVFPPRIARGGALCSRARRNPTSRCPGLVGSQPAPTAQH